MMRHNPLSFIVGLILLPALAVAHQDDIQRLKTLHVQKAQLNSTKGSVVTQRTSVRNAAAPMVQLAQADVPAGSGQELQHNYLKSIAENAIRSSAENALRKPMPMQTADSNPGSETPLPTPISSQEKKRVDKIRSIVSEAVSDAPPGQSDESMSEPVGQTPQTSSPQQRRQQLRKVIVDAPPAKDEASKGYLSKLKDEVSTTVVIDEESARRTAVPATATSSEAGGKTAAESLVLEGDGTYLYTVRAGDSLWMIAQHFYRDGHRYVELFQANRALLDNADLLTVGQVLRVPNAEVKD